MNRDKGRANINIPIYIEDILTNNYCPSFLRMSMVKEMEDYRFSYKTECFRQLNIDLLSTRNKLVLLRSLINIFQRNEEWLIRAEQYKLEPELIYSVNNSVEDGSIRLLYYPDGEEQSFRSKIVGLAQQIADRKDRKEADIINGFAQATAGEDWNRARMYLDKHIMRLDVQHMQKVS